MKFSWDRSRSQQRQVVVKPEKQTGAPLLSTCVTRSLGQWRGHLAVDDGNADQRQEGNHQWLDAGLESISGSFPSRSMQHPCCAFDRRPTNGYTHADLIVTKHLI